MLTNVSSYTGAGEPSEIVASRELIIVQMQLSNLSFEYPVDLKVTAFNHFPN